MPDVQHFRGVAAVSMFPDAAPGPGAAQVLFGMLLDLQHRGQLSAGFTTFGAGRPRRLRTARALGTVSHGFGGAQGAELLADLDGTCGIGHTRYATCGADDVDYAQPYERPHGRLWKWFSICFNGQIANFAELRNRLAVENDYHLVRQQADTEVLMHHIAHGMRGDERRPIDRVFAEMATHLDGAYTIGYVNAEGDLVVARDPHGFRPVCYGTNGRFWAAASESVALANLGVKDIHALEPGMMAVVKDGRADIRRFAEAPRHGRCYFEWVYFASAGSVIDDRSVYLARKDLGRELALAETQPIGDDCIVVPVPDCAKAAADGMAYELGVPCLEGLLRNRYLGRTFIEGATRAEKARRKYIPLPEVLDGKRVFLVEDSIVRLTTLRVVLQQMRERAGAREIHVRVTCPPVIAPCFYGIDMSTLGELYAYRFFPQPVEGPLPKDVLDRMAADMGADSLIYLPLDVVPRCIGLDRSELCMACIDAKYPTPAGRALYEEAVRRAHAGESGSRTYEGSCS